MAPLIERLLACGPPLLLGTTCILAWTFILMHLSPESSSEARASTPFISKAWSLFVAGVNHPIGFIVIREHCFLSFVYALLRGFESCRARASVGPLITVPLLQLLPVPLGAGLSFSLLWLPSYLLSGSQDRSPWVSKRKVLSRGQVKQNLLLVLGTVLLSLLTVAWAQEGGWVTNTGTLLLSQLVLLVRFFLQLRFPSRRPALRSQDSEEMEEKAADMYLVAFGTSLAWRIYALTLLFHNPLRTSQLLDILQWRGDSDTLVVVWLFGVDLVLLTLSLAYFASVEDGSGVALRAMVGVLLLGPATAFSIYLVCREKQIRRSMGRRMYGIVGAVAQAA